MGKRGLKISLGITLPLGLIVLAAGIALPILVSKMVDSGLKDQLVVTSFNSSQFEDWRAENTNKLPIMKNVYFFNLSNPDEFLEGAKPNLTQIGPFAYQDIKYRFNISWSEDKNTVGFQTWEYFLYNESLSCDICKEDLVLTSINMPAVGVRAAFEKLLGNSLWTELTLGTLFAGEQEPLVIRRPAGELLWGYDDQLLALVYQLTKQGSPRFAGLQTNLTTMESSPPLDIVQTGNDGIKNLDNYLMWSANSSLGVWMDKWPNGTSTGANLISGTDGQQYGPGTATPEHPLLTWVDDIFRTLFLEYKKDVEHRKIKMLRYGLRDKDLANCTTEKAQCAFYQHGPYGIMNLTSAQAGTPIFVTKPQFLDAPDLLDTVVGFKPTYDQHDTYLDIEPISGATMYARKRLQINVELTPFIGIYGSIPHVFFPLLWVEEAALISEDLAKQFRDKIYFAEDLKKYSRWGGIFGGGALLLIACALAFVLYKRRDRSIELKEPLADRAGYTLQRD